jgi:D-cysteine desulfhydrase family pyridoxal phosphate-dependent enzyme
VIGASLPRVLLGSLPTPVHELPRLSAALGRRILIKRDDQTGLALGGNKTRKLELLLAAAQADGCDTLITGGAAQSNHCRQTAAAAARAGLRCVLVLAGDPRGERTGNLLLDQLLGAELVWSRDRSRDEALEATLRGERAAGRRPYLIPYGGSSPVGAAAYALAMEELVLQGVRPDVVVFASSSGGTHAGLAVGARALGFAGELHGVSIDRPAAELRRLVAELGTRTAALLELPLVLRQEEIVADDRFLGGGYGVVGDPEREAILLFARSEGILLDPVYTGRAAAGMIALIRGGEVPATSTLLFWHTGGAPALWAYADELLPR